MMLRLVAVIVCLLIGTSFVTATEKIKTIKLIKPVKPVEIKPEDLKVVAAMEDLKLMDVAEDLDMLIDINYLIEDDQHENKKN
jgi:hypothetical protein